MREDFALLILSHNRADRIETLDTFKKAGYTGKWYIIIDNEDKAREKYINNYGEEHIIIFDKEESAKHFDIMDNFEGKQSPIYARNTLHSIAKDLNLNYFLELDDDYDDLRIRYDEDGVLKSCIIKDFDSLANEFISFLESTNTYCICLAQMGDYIGGIGSKVYNDKLSRKAMNSFFCKTDRPFKFIGRFNDDVNMYTQLGKIGYLLFTVGNVAINQGATQQNTGGITEAYVKYGTYVKSFYSVILNPSFMKVSVMGNNHKRIHHLVEWEHAVPKIINQRYKK